MAKQIHYNVGELKQLIRESQQEFKPVLGAGVESDNKKNNDKSYKDAEKRAKDFDGGLKDETKKKLAPKEDANRTTLDFNPRTEPDKSYKERVEAQAKGYTSKLEEDNGIEKAAEFDKDGKIYNQFKDSSEELKKEREDLSQSGIQGHNMEKHERESVYENTLKPKRLVFKHTQFINENFMLNRIPEEYKKDGQIIYMKDSVGNEYMVECEKSSKGYIETNIKSYTNENIINEQMSRINKLMNYSVGNHTKENVRSFRINEDRNFNDMLDIARSMNNK